MKSQCVLYVYNYLIVLCYQISLSRKRSNILWLGFIIIMLMYRYRTPICVTCTLYIFFSFSCLNYSRIPWWSRSTSFLTTTRAVISIRTFCEFHGFFLDALRIRLANCRELSCLIGQLGSLIGDVCRFCGRPILLLIKISFPYDTTR